MTGPGPDTHLLLEYSNNHALIPGLSGIMGYSCFDIPALLLKTEILFDSSNNS